MKKLDSQMELIPSLTHNPFSLFFGKVLRRSVPRPRLQYWQNRMICKMHINKIVLLVEPAMSLSCVKEKQSELLYNWKFTCATVLRQQCLWSRTCTTGLRKAFWAFYLESESFTLLLTCLQRQTSLNRGIGRANIAGWQQGINLNSRSSNLRAWREHDKMPDESGQMRLSYASPQCKENSRRTRQDLFRDQ